MALARALVLPRALARAAAAAPHLSRAAGALGARAGAPSAASLRAARATAFRGFATEGGASQPPPSEKPADAGAAGAAQAKAPEAPVDPAAAAAAAAEKEIATLKEKMKQLQTVRIELLQEIESVRRIAKNDVDKTKM
jgi:molecular chaperone GrpE